MANKSTSKSAGGIQDPEAGKIILNLFSKLDSNDIDGSIVSMKKNTLKEVKVLGTSTSFQDWQRVKVRIMVVIRQSVVPYMMTSILT